MKQWHPLFAALLRPMVENWFRVETNMPVGDVPREADLVLLLLTATTAPPFRGLWRFLTACNVLEFKGPNEAASVGDLDLLVELGLGIHRKLNEERRKQREALLEPDQVSFWYIVHYLGRRFLTQARDRLGPLEELAAGLWRSRSMRRSLVLVSSRDLAVERDSVPLHLLVKRPGEGTRSAAVEVARNSELWRMDAGWVSTLFPGLWEEVRRMARRSQQGPVLHWDAVIKQYGLKAVLDQVIEVGGVEKVIEEVGLDKVLETVPATKVVEAVGMERFLAQLTPKQKRDMLRRLQAESA